MSNENDSIELKYLALKECVTILKLNIDDYYAGKFDLKFAKCPCGKKTHIKEAIYCSMCGGKLEEIAGNDSL